jgi:hypothetical protein
MAGLHVPLSTLHVQPRDCPRMTRGQVGSLLLTCATLTFATPRRFIPAHSHVVPIFDLLRPVGVRATFSVLAATERRLYPRNSPAPAMMLIAAVAEACNHPNLLVLPFRSELIRLAA